VPQPSTAFMFQLHPPRSPLRAEWNDTAHSIRHLQHFSWLTYSSKF
jgi:hypothetical protein